MASRQTLAVLAFSLLLLAAAPVTAQQYYAPGGSWLDSPELTGQWFGLRPALADEGITLQADTTNFYFGNTAGGIRQNFAFGGHGDYVLNFDAHKLGGPEGLFVKLRAEHRYGQTITSDVGAFISPTLSADLPNPNTEELYLTNVLFTQMFSESFGIFFGKLDTLDGDMNAFAHGRGKTQFSNLAFCFNPIAAATVPYSTLGAGVVFLQEGEQIASFSVLNSQDTSSTSGFSELFEDGVLLSGFIRLPTSFFGLPGHQLLGGTWNSRSYASIGDAYIQYPQIIIPRTEGSWSIYWNFDQYLVVDPCDPTRGWGVFGRAGIADEQTNPMAWFLSFGVGGSVPFESRPEDTYGVGWYYAGLSDQIGPIFDAVVGPTGAGQGVELFYNYELTPAIRLTPDLQVQVPAREEIDPALIAGLRAQLIF